MINPFDKFSNHYKQSLQTAAVLAQNLNQPSIDPIHILYGLIMQKGSVGAELFTSLDLKPENIKNYIAQNYQAENPIEHKKDPDLSKEVKKIIQKSVHIAYINGHPYIGTEHLLASLLQTKDSQTEEVIKTLKIGKADLIQKTIGLLKSTSKFPDITETFKVKKTKASTFDGFFGAGQKALDSFGLDLTSKASQNKIDPIIGRDNEIQRLIQILCRRTKNNPIILGDPGVGKTALAEGLAKKICEGDVPEVLQNKKIYAIDLAGTLAGTMYRGDFENRVKKIIDEVKNQPDVILFIDEIHNIVGAGNSTGAMDAANILKPALARGEIRCIGATTYQDYRKTIENDPALDRRFQPVKIAEPSLSEAKLILQGLKSYFENFHGIEIEESAIESAVNLSQRYLTDRFLPDKAIDLLDEACAMVKINRQPSTLEQKIKEYTEKVKNLNQAKKRAVANEDYEHAIQLKERYQIVKGELVKLEQQLLEQTNLTNGRISQLDIAKVLSKTINIPVEDLLTSEQQRILKLSQTLKTRVIGQDKAIEQISNLVTVAKAGLRNCNQPLASMLLLGPSGVGKTYTASLMAETIFGKPEALVKIDMSEYSEKFNLSKLIGAPAGYVGYKESGQLTEKIKHQPYSLVLLDEVEKANPDIFDLLLSVLADGYLTDATGRKINFSNTIIVMTSNLGSDFWNENKKIGFDDVIYQEMNVMEEQVNQEVAKHFKIEFINRLDKIICFNPLPLSDWKKITKLEMDKLTDKLKVKNINIEYDNKIINLIAKSSYIKPIGGVRSLQKSVQTIVEIPLAEKLLANQIKTNDNLIISADKNAMQVMAKNVIIN